MIAAIALASAHWVVVVGGKVEQTIIRS